MTKAEQRKFDEEQKRLKEIELANNPVPFNIAAFDQATECGVAYELSDTNTPIVEIWNLAIKGKQSQGIKWMLFEQRLKKFLTDNNISLLMYELPAGRHANAIIHSSKLICIIEKVCCELEIEYAEISSKTIKKFATGNGNAGKPLMVEFAQKLWGYDGENDNEADALHILHYLKTLINF